MWKEKWLEYRMYMDLKISCEWFGWIVSSCKEKDCRIRNIVNNFCNVCNIYNKVLKFLYYMLILNREYFL